MRVSTAQRLLMMTAVPCMLQACLGTGAPTSPAQPLPLPTLSPGSPPPDANAGLSPEEARAEAVAEIRAKAQAHEIQQEEAPYPHVFVAHGPPTAITSRPKSQRQIEMELAAARGALEEATDPDEVEALAERMARLRELGRTHAQQSEQQIQANSERVR